MEASRYLVSDKAVTVGSERSQCGLYLVQSMTHFSRLTIGCHRLRIGKQYSDRTDGSSIHSQLPTSHMTTTIRQARLPNSPFLTSHYYHIRAPFNNYTARCLHRHHPTAGARTSTAHLIQLAHYIVRALVHRKRGPPLSVRPAYSRSFFLNCLHQFRFGSPLWLFDNE